MKEIEFNVTERSVIRQKEAPIIVPLLIKLRTPKKVVNAARPPASPLHKYFTWDDEIAAERWRQVEAARLFQSVAVPTVEGKKIAPDNMRFMHSIPARLADVHGKGSATRQYYTLSEVTRDPKLSSALLSDARRDLVNWKNKYSVYATLIRSARFRQAMIEVQNAIDSL